MQTTTFGPRTDPGELSALIRAMFSDDRVESEAAWRRFIDRYCPIVYRLAKKKGLDRVESEEIFQNFCVQMLRSLESFEYDPARGRFRRWVLTVALSQIRHHWRKQASANRLKRGLFEKLEAEGAFDPEKNIPWFEAAESARRMHEAVSLVKPNLWARDWDIFESVTLRGEPRADVAARHGLTTNALYGVTFRVLQQVRDVCEQLRED